MLIKILTMLTNSLTCHVEYFKQLLKEIRLKREKQSDVTLSTFEVVPNKKLLKENF